jgi:hypothetical protein
MGGRMAGAQSCSHIHTHSKCPERAAGNHINCISRASLGAFRFNPQLHSHRRVVCRHALNVRRAAVAPGSYNSTPGHRVFLFVASKHADGGDVRLRCFPAVYMELLSHAVAIW